jgi:hypothetical protein
MTQLTSIQLIEAALWRELGSTEPQSQDVLRQALADAVSRWLLIRSQTPDIDALKFLAGSRPTLLNRSVSYDRLEATPLRGGMVGRIARQSVRMDLPPEPRTAPEADELSSRIRSLSR